MELSNQNLCRYYSKISAVQKETTVPCMVAGDFPVVVSDKLWWQAVVGDTAGDELTQKLQPITVEHHVPFTQC